MGAFGIGASVAGVAGLASGAALVALTPDERELGADYEGFTRDDAQFAVGMALPVGFGIGAFGAINDVPTMMIAGTFLLGATVGGIAGTLGAGVADARAAARG